MIKVLRWKSKKHSSSEDAEKARQDADKLREEVATRRRILLQKTLEISKRKGTQHEHG